MWSPLTERQQYPASNSCEYTCEKLSGGSDFSITPPPPPKESPLPPIVRQWAKKRTSATMSVDELKAIMQTDQQATTSFSVSTIDESPTGQTKKAMAGAAPTTHKKQKTPSRVEDDRVSVLKELGSAVQMYKDRATAAGKAPQKVEDDVSVWAGQIERKVHQIAEPMLQEDLMDHLSFIVKQTYRGQWSVSILRSPTFTISKLTKLPLSSFVPSLPPAPVPVGRQHQGNTDSFTQSSTQQVFTPQMQQVQSTDHLAAFVQWLQSGPSSNSPGLPQGPQAQPVDQNVALRYATAAKYSTLSTVNIQNQPRQ